MANKIISQRWLKPLISLVRLKKKYKKEEFEEDFAEEGKSISRGKFIGIWIAAVIFLLIGFFEITMRSIDLDTIELENNDVGYNIIVDDFWKWVRNHRVL